MAQLSGPMHLLVAREPHARRGRRRRRSRPEPGRSRLAVVRGQPISAPARRVAGDGRRVPSLRLANSRAAAPPDVGRSLRRAGRCRARAASWSGCSAGWTIGATAPRRWPALCREHGIALALLPGDGQADPRLADAVHGPAGRLGAPGRLFPSRRPGQWTTTRWRSPPTSRAGAPTTRPQRSRCRNTAIHTLDGGDRPAAGGDRVLSLPSAGGRHRPGRRACGGAAGARARRAAHCTWRA